MKYRQLKYGNEDFKLITELTDKARTKAINNFLQFQKDYHVNCVTAYNIMVNKLIKQGVTQDIAKKVYKNELKKIQKNEEKLNKLFNDTDIYNYIRLNNCCFLKNGTYLLPYAYKLQDIIKSMTIKGIF